MTVCEESYGVKYSKSEYGLNDINDSDRNISYVRCHPDLLSVPLTVVVIVVIV